MSSSSQRRKAQRKISQKTIKKEEEKILYYKKSIIMIRGKFILLEREIRALEKEVQKFPGDFDIEDDLEYKKGVYLDEVDRKSQIMTKLLLSKYLCE